MNVTQNYYEIFKNKFEILKNQIQPYLSDYDDYLVKCEKENSPNFNVFKILGIHRKEASTHTPLLAELLNPSGVHGQGALFLQSLLVYMHQKYNFLIPEDIPNGSWDIQTEYRLEKYGRIDILLRSWKYKYLLLIENKIYASEQDNQLLRYINWMDSQKLFKTRQIIFLTPSGKESKTAKKREYFNISYKDDIYHILRNSAKLVESVRVNEVIQQYNEIIKAV